MSYLALYRKYRSQNFDEIVGQDSIVEILKNQIRNNKFGHAYIFSGIRGTGKTSVAKIMSKAVNCLNLVDGNPCNECEICKEINNDSFMDVVEIDAASNNGVDNVRELREHSKYLPSKGKYKVYIIDEVQMLSIGAFNALLKTLEEPSEHILFILATTEPQKIPVTILSRCQRYDFKRISIKDIIGRMKYVLNDMNYSYDEESLNLIAIKSDGAMRDALSLLEKVVSKSGNSVSIDITKKVLGVIEFDALIRLFEYTFSGKGNEAILELDQLINDGVSISNILNQILEFTRNLMILNLFKKPNELVNLPNELQINLIDKFSNIDMKTTRSAIEMMNEYASKLKYSLNQRLNLELMIISISLIKSDFLVDEEVKEKSEKKADVKIKIEEPIIKNDDTIKKHEKDIVKEIKEDKIISREIISDSNNVLNKWDDILSEVNKKKKIAYAFLVEGSPREIKGNKIMIEYKDGYEFHMENVSMKENREIIEKSIFDVTGEKYLIEIVTEEKKNKNETVDEVEELKSFLGKEFEKILKIE